MLISGMHIIQPVSFLVTDLIHFCQRVADPDDGFRNGVLIKDGTDVVLQLPTIRFRNGTASTSLTCI